MDLFLRDTVDLPFFYRFRAQTVSWQQLLVSKMLPECRDLLGDDGAPWMCARSVSFGSFCLATLALAGYGCNRILPIFLQTRWYASNLTMLALTTLQMLLLVVECFVQSSTKILVLAKYCRGVQIATSCLLYGQLACELMNRSRLVRHIHRLLMLL